MKKEVQSIIRNLISVNSGEPWFGRAVYTILDEIDPAIVHQKPKINSHSMIQLLYHMITWAEFTLKSIEKTGKEDIEAIEQLDWREIDPAIHSWQKGLAEFKNINEQIIALLETKDDDFLKEIVQHRKFNFRFMLNGLIQHNIYHLGQIAYLKKLLS